MATTPKTGQLRVTALTVRDVLGAQEVTIEPGQVTVVSGPNGSGKSTIMTALQAALGGGKLANLARIDAAKGKAEAPEIVLVLQGPGVEEYRVHKRAADLKVKGRVGDSAAFAEIPQPQAWLSSLFDPKGSNPVAFLTAADKDRALMLLEALPLAFDRDALLAAMALRDPSILPAVPRGLHPLEEVALLRDGVFKARTGVNTSAREARAAGEKLRRGAPAVIPGDPVAAIADLEGKALALAGEVAREEEVAKAAERAERAAAGAAHGVGEQAIRSAFKAWRAERQGQHELEAAEIRAEAERRIAKLAGEMDAEVDARATKDEEALDALERARDERLAVARKALDAGLEATKGRRQEQQDLAEKLGQLRAQSEEAKRAATLHAEAAKFDEEADGHEAESLRLTAALDALDAYRRRMAEELPIAGLEIEGKEIRVHGVPFEQLNTAQRIEIAVEVAALRAQGQRLPVVFVDGAEALDREHFDALVAALTKRGLQAFVARVTDQPFTVATDAAAAPKRGRGIAALIPEEVKP